jgi:hypothetical protein
MTITHPAALALLRFADTRPDTAEHYRDCAAVLQYLVDDPRASSGEPWPKPIEHDPIAAATGLHRAQVSNALFALAKWGLLSKVGVIFGAIYPHLQQNRLENLAQETGEQSCS